MLTRQKSYASAWTTLFVNLELKSGQTLLIRGATSSFGQAAVNLAVNAGAKVIATARNVEKSSPMLAELGVQYVVQEGPELLGRLADKRPIDAVLDLVGNSVVLESLSIVRRGGRVCLAGWLGGLAPIADFNPLLQMPSGRYLTFFGSFHFGTPEFIPVSDVPLQKIANEVLEGRYKAAPFKVFAFEDIAKAHEFMESGQSKGKLVVKVGE
jgi:NADPH2:quinone reductase